MGIALPTVDLIIGTSLASSVFAYNYVRSVADSAERDANEKTYRHFRNAKI